jgi:hypothetical protein
MGSKAWGNYRPQAGRSVRPDNRWMRGQCGLANRRLLLLNNYDFDSCLRPSCMRKRLY